MEEVQVAIVGVIGTIHALPAARKRQMEAQKQGRLRACRARVAVTGMVAKRLESKVVIDDTLGDAHVNTHQKKNELVNWSRYSRWQWLPLC